MSVPMPARKVEPPPGFEHLADAARRRGVSERTLRRQIQAGIVPAEMFQRPQGEVWFVPIPEETMNETRPKVGTAVNDQEEPKGGNEAALTERSLGILEALLLANGETMERQAERIAALERECGERAWRNHAQENEILRLEAEVERLRAEAARPWYRRLW